MVNDYLLEIVGAPCLKLITRTGMFRKRKHKKKSQSDIVWTTNVLKMKEK